MHRKTLLTLSLLAAVAATAPTGALAQSGGLDEYQEGAPTAGGEQSGVPGGGNQGDGGSSNGGNSSNGSGADDSSDPAVSPTTDPSATPQGTGGSIPSGPSDGSVSGSSGTELQPSGSPGSPRASGSPSVPARGAPVPVTNEVAVAPAPFNDRTADLRGILALALALVAMGAVGTFLYRRKYGDIASPRARPVGRQSVAASSR